MTWPRPREPLKSCLWWAIKFNRLSIPCSTPIISFHSRLPLISLRSNAQPADQWLSLMLPLARYSAWRWYLHLIMFNSTLIWKLNLKLALIHLLVTKVVHRLLLMIRISLTIIVSTSIFLLILLCRCLYTLYVGPHMDLINDYMISSQHLSSCDASDT